MIDKSEQPRREPGHPSGTPSGEDVLGTTRIHGLDDDDIETLVPGARSHFAAAVATYTQQLFNEAKGIEQLEHAGTGPAEITAAHVEEAKWVLVRRARRRSKHSKWVAAARVGQVVSSAGIGIGGSNFSDDWGSVMCIISVLLGSLLLLVERELSREA